MRISIIGGGNMGQTFAKAFANSRIVHPKDIFIIEKNIGDRLNNLQSQGIASVGNDYEVLKRSDLCVLAVKPQDSLVVLENIKALNLPKEFLILSVMAGVNIDFIMVNTGLPKIIRSMPNLASQVGKGMTGYFCSEDVTRKEEVDVRNLLESTGKTLQVDNEEMLNAITAISDSGPAYLFYMMQTWMNAAEKMGFTNSEANLLVQQTIEGALSLYRQNTLSCDDWVKMVSSRGGTTEAAIKHMDSCNINKNFEEACLKALRRAEELSKRTN